MICGRVGTRAPTYVMFGKIHFSTLKKPHLLFVNDVSLEVAPYIVDARALQNAATGRDTTFPPGRLLLTS